LTFAGKVEKVKRVDDSIGMRAVVVVNVICQNADKMEMHAHISSHMSRYAQHSAEVALSLFLTVS
jgi:hypothetical protein